jgi:flagellar biosynthesis protein FlhA
MLSRDLETKIKDALHRTDDGTYLALDPGVAQAIISDLGDNLKHFMGSAAPILLCPSTIRPHVKRLTERYLPSLVVLSHNEIAPHLKVRSLGTVTIDAG